jgi:hypothetical protein
LGVETRGIGFTVFSAPHENQMGQMQSGKPINPPEHRVGVHYAVLE